VIYDLDEPVAFSAQNRGGRFKGNNPTVSEVDLVLNWVGNTKFVYIGKAVNLRRRLIQYADFGEGKPVGHWGGRLIWQLSQIEALRVTWKETPNLDPGSIEVELLAEFRRQYGKPPFANDPHRLGN